MGSLCLVISQILPVLQRVPEKIAQSSRTTILQLYVTKPRGFLQNVLKEIVYTIKASV